MIKIIVAAALNGVIGKNGQLPWDLPTDMKHFKNITFGHNVIMSRPCWESIPKRFRPLPNRINYVLTRNKEYVANGAKLVHSLDDKLNKFKDSKESLFVIGGAELYNEMFEHADELFLTTIYNDVDGDSKIDKLDLNKWKMTDISELISENGFDYSISHYVKI